MLSRDEIISRLTNPGIISVVRTEEPEHLPELCDALIAGGVVAIEITFTVPNALEAIRTAAAHCGSRGLVGAGTVLNARMAHDAIASGAQFVVSPITRLEIVNAAHERGKPVMLGAYTPTEAQTAHEAGADFIKIFPADRLGPGYIKSIRAPLPHLKIVPTGGVDLNTAGDFLKAGCAALGVGGALLTAEILQTQNWAELTRLARAFAEIARAHPGR